MEHSKNKLAFFTVFNLSDVMISQIYQILKDRLGDKFYLRLLFRGSRDGFTDAKFHELCDNQGSLLVLVKTGKDILIGGFSSIPWKNSGGWTVDPKCVVFSLTRNKTYIRHNDTGNVHFSRIWGPFIGYDGFGIMGK
jgi:hypothetical protein